MADETTEAKTARTPRARRSRVQRAESRRSSSRSLWIAASIVGIAVIALAGFIGYSIFSERMQAAEKYESAKALIEDADSVVVQVDGIVRDKITAPGLAKEAQAATTRIPDARAKLTQALDLLEEGQAKRKADDQKQAVLLRATADARLKMLAEADKILPLNAKAATALPLAKSGWDAVIAADKLSDSAVASYNKLSKAGVTQSSALNKQAAVKLAAAKKSFEAAEKAFPEAGFDAYISYVNRRIKLNTLSQRSDAAWLKGDLKGANAVIASYNAEDKLAVEQAKKLPTSAEAAVASAYDAAAGGPTDQYYLARDAATKADEALRDF